MADAQVLTPDQIAQLLAAQQQSAASTSNSAATPTHRLKTSFKKRRAFEPFYTGGATALTPDGSLLFATLNEEVAVVDVASGAIVQRIEGDTEEVTALAVSPDGSHLVIASRSLQLRIFKLPECRLVRTIAKSHVSQVNLMSVDPTSTLLATGGSDGVAKVWDVEGGFCTHAFKGHAGVVSALAWNLPPPSSSSASSSTATPSKNKSKSKSKAAGVAHQRTMQLLTGSVDGKVRVWDLNNPSEMHKPIATLSGHDSVVRGIAVTHDGHTVVSGSRDRTLVVWRMPPAKSGIPNVADWKQAETLSANEGIEALGFLPMGSFSPDDKQNVFYTGGSDGHIRLWDVYSSSIIAREPKSFNDRLAHRAREERKRRALAAGRSIDDLDAEDEETRAINAVHLVEGALVSVHADQNVVVRSLHEEEPLSKVRQLIGFNDEIVDLALLSDDGAARESHLAVATNSRSLRVYTLNGDGEEGEEETSAELLAGHTDIVLCLDRSPDMRLLASGAKDRSVRVWACVPSSRLARSTEEAAAEQRGDAGKRINRKAHAATNAEAVEHGSKGEWICVAVAEGHAESVGAVAFARRPSAPGAPGAPFLVTASQDRTVKIWDLGPLSTLLFSTSTPISAPLALKSLTTQRVHEKDINCLDVAPNNAMVATGSQDRTAKVFSLAFTPASAKGGATAASARLTTLATLKGHKRGVWACRFSPVDLALATSSGDKSIRLWSLKTFSSVKLFEGHTNSVLKLSFLSQGMQLASCAGDGLIKLWNIKDEECTTTIDAADDKIWSLVVAKSEGWMVSASADGRMTVWEDRSKEEEEEKRVEREEEVRMEQEFGNMLTTKDWRRAIGLALEMGQPRRLLGLFTHVAVTRPEASSSGANNNHGLLASALRLDDSDTSDDEDGMIELNSDALESASIRPKSSRQGGRKSNKSSSNGHKPSASDAHADADANSITGLAAVDRILSTLPRAHLIQLLLYIRDWNTSTRTAPVAQTLLHAILSSHSAAALIAMFDASSQSHRAALAERLENEELGIVEAKSDKQRARERRLDRERNVDLGTLVEGLLPYTQRHWERADRVLVEASMLEYAVEAMDTLLGFQASDDEEEDHAETFAERLDMDQDSQNEDVQDADEVMSDASVSS